MLKSGFGAFSKCLGGSRRIVGYWARRSWESIPSLTYLTSAMSEEGGSRQTTPEDSTEGDQGDTSTGVVVEGPHLDKNEGNIGSASESVHQLEEAESNKGANSESTKLASSIKLESKEVTGNKESTKNPNEQEDKDRMSVKDRNSNMEKDKPKDKNEGARKNSRDQQGGKSFFSGWGWLKKSKTDMPKRDRQYYESLPLQEKRKLYKCRNNFVTLDKIEAWPETRHKLEWRKEGLLPKPLVNPFPLLDRKVSLWRGDITQLEVDAIVNAANSSLLGGGGVDGAIHRAAGDSLYEECLTLNGCRTGETKLTSGHALPAKYILHTVGPYDGSERDLRSCYETCLNLVEEHNIKSVAFCCIATGVYGYPNDRAAVVALETIRKWLKGNAEKVNRIIFCVFLEKDLKIYKKKLHQYFPEEADEEQVNSGTSTREQGGTSENTGEEKVGTTSGEDSMEVSSEDKESSSVPPLLRCATEPTPGTQKSDNNNSISEPMETDVDEVANKGSSVGDNDAKPEGSPKKPEEG